MTPNLIAALPGARFDAAAYASQGNAILGIRDSGKSYLATLVGEYLMDADIPFTAFDPIGLWRFLRVPGKGKGYPVVVAGGEHGDLPLTPEGAPEIVRAAMRAGVSLVIDLYSIDLSKADWRRIVESCVRVLLYENKPHGLRHIFIEEAAEFCPQMVDREHGRVYAEIEKLARMGGNAMLGYTLISQRAEQVNKAVLELCDALFLFRQKGRLSLTALSKWLGIADAKGGSEIVASLPTLAQGVCWVWPAGTDSPVKVKVPHKRTFHPDRRALHGAVAEIARQAVDVGTFVETMKASLVQLEAEIKANDPKTLQARIRELERENAALMEDGVAPDPGELDRATAEAHRVGFDEGWRALAEKVRPIIDLSSILTPPQEPMPAGELITPDQLGHAVRREVSRRRPMREIIYRRPDKKPNGDGLAVKIDPSSINVVPAQRRILDALAWLESVGIERAHKTQLALLAGQSPNSSSYANNLGALRSAGLVIYPSGGTVQLTPYGEDHADRPTRPPTTRDLHDAIERKLAPAQWRILRELIRVYPRHVTREHLADQSDQSPGSSSYANNLGALRSLGFLDYPERGFVVAKPVLFL